jgi:predicted alpha/beta hydrolase family esterase
MRVFRRSSTNTPCPTDPASSSFPAGATPVPAIGKACGPSAWPTPFGLTQDDWITPSRAAWIESIGRTILRQGGPVVIAAHSLGCIATTHLPPEVVERIQGALLVAPADPERRGVLADFAPVPFQKLPYRSVLVASSNDPFCPVRQAGAYARAWGSEFVRVQDGGHLNVESGHGEWPLGLALLQSLVGEGGLALKPATRSLSNSTDSLETA